MVSIHLSSTSQAWNVYARKSSRENNKWLFSQYSLKGRTRPLRNVNTSLLTAPTTGTALAWHERRRLWQSRCDRQTSNACVLNRPQNAHRHSKLTHFSKYGVNRIHLVRLILWSIVTQPLGRLSWNLLYLILWGVLSPLRAVRMWYEGYSAFYLIVVFTFLRGVSCPFN